MDYPRYGVSCPACRLCCSTSARVWNSYAPIWNIVGGIKRVGTQLNQFQWLLEAEIAQRQDRGLDGLPPAFVQRYTLTRTPTANTILTLRADAGRERVAAMMFLIHGASATYHIGWTSEAGRDAYAHNLILWKAIEELKARGIQQLDLGGVNTIRSAGVARFKLRTGGKLVTLAGSYLL